MSKFEHLETLEADGQYWILRASTKRKRGFAEPFDPTKGRRFPFVCRHGGADFEKLWKKVPDKVFSAAKRWCSQWALRWPWERDPSKQSSLLGGVKRHQRTHVLLWDTTWRSKHVAEQVAADYKRDTGCRALIVKLREHSYGVYAAASERKCKDKQTSLLGVKR